MAKAHLLPQSDLAPAPDPVARLNRALAELKAQAIQPVLVQAVELLDRDDYRQAADLALKALELDETCAVAWQIMAVCRDRARDFSGALACYEAALKIDPDNPDYANNIGRLAHQMGRGEVAEKLFRLALQLRPDFIDGFNNLACTLRDQMRYDEAIALLRQGLAIDTASPLLWNTLGTVVAERGEVELAMTFYAEALRLDPTLAKARYNLSHSRQALGDLEGALADCEAAIGPTTVESEQAMMRFARATILLSGGQVLEGWKAYAARLDPFYAETCLFMVDRPAWTPDMDLEGRSLLLIGEQGLGDEVLFANLVPDVIDALGPRGRLWLAVTPRLVPLFQRSFPQATVLAHATGTLEHRNVRAVPDLTDLGAIDLWAPMASPLERFRPSVASFPDRRAFLTPDPTRVAHWRALLAEGPPGLRVGLLWKSLKINSARSRYYSPFDAWAPVLRTPGARMVNLQYGDGAAEIARAREAFGVEVWTPPGIDLKNDLDDVTALCRALDLVIGPPNATTNLAAAAGVPTWLVSTAGSWPMLGTGRYPWYPSVQVFSPPGFNDWPAAMAQVAETLQAEGALAA